MKKILVLTLCLSMVLSIAGCGKKPEEKKAEENIKTEQSTSVQETEKEDVEKEVSIKDSTGKYEMIPLDELYKDDKEDYQLIKGLQGKIKAIESPAAFYIYADGKIYEKLYNNFAEVADVGADIDIFSCFQNTDVGKVILAVDSNSATSVMFDENGSSYDIYSEELSDFDINTFLFKEVDFNHFCTVTIEAQQCKVRSYTMPDKNDNAGRKPTLGDEVLISKYETKDGVELGEMHLVSVEKRDVGSGTVVCCITKNHELYIAEDYNKITQSLIMGTKTPLATNVNWVYSGNGIANTILPIYSKVDDKSNIYTTVSGISITDASDNQEVKIVMPDGYENGNIAEIFGCDDSVFVRFNSGNVFFTGKIDKKSGGTYEMTEHLLLSELYKENKVSDICADQAYHGYIYVLTNDGKLYYTEAD